MQPSRCHVKGGGVTKSEATPEDGQPALVHADHVLPRRRPGDGADGRTEEEADKKSDVESSNQDAGVCGPSAVSPVFVRKAGLQLAGEQIPDVHSSVGRPGSQETAIWAEQAKREC